MKVEWGRVYRGVVWHVLGRGSERTLCEDQAVREVTEGQPPRGARVCDDCAHDVAQMARAVEVAREQTRLPERLSAPDAIMETNQGITLDTDRSVT